MTSRERVRKTLDHKEPDRIPIDNNGIVSSIHEVAYQNLLETLGLEEEVVILDPVQRIVLNSEQILKALRVDTRYLYPNAPPWWEYRENPGKLPDPGLPSRRDPGVDNGLWWRHPRADR
ncbi:hypothetical protein ES703_52963 [subsurface metagenome]